MLSFEDAYINSKEFGIVKILEVKYDFESQNPQNTIAIDAEGFVKAILRDALKDKTDFLVMH